MERAWAGRAGRTRLESRPHCATSYTSYFSSLSLSFPVSENWIIPCAQRRKLISAWPFGGYSVTLLLRWAGLQDGAQDVCPWLWAGLVNTMGPHSHDHVMLHGKREFADVIRSLRKLNLSESKGSLSWVALTLSCEPLKEVRSNSRYSPAGFELEDKLSGRNWMLSTTWKRTFSLRWESNTGQHLDSVLWETEERTQLNPIWTSDLPLWLSSNKPD